MSFQASLEPHYHQEFHFAPDQESSGCCCFWKSSPKKKEFIVDANYNLKAVHKTNYSDRIEANQKLAKLVSKKFDADPLENNKDFECLKIKINESFDGDDPITSERLAKIVNAIYDIRKSSDKS